MTIIQTERLILRLLTLADAPFILTLVNDPSWIENIGDKQVHNIADAENYLTQGPLKSYQVNKFGLYLVQLKSNQQAVGMCGLVKREVLDAPDIGFALLPDYWGMGLASEAAQATLAFAHDTLNIPQVLGITNLDNVSSARVLENIGMQFDKNIQLPGFDKVNKLYVSPADS